VRRLSSRALISLDRTFSVCDAARTRRHLRGIGLTDFVQEFDRGVDPRGQVTAVADRQGAGLRASPVCHAATDLVLLHRKD